jgi:hypothetical protein
MTYVDSHNGRAYWARQRMCRRPPDVGAYDHGIIRLWYDDTLDTGSNLLSNVRTRMSYSYRSRSLSSCMTFICKSSKYDTNWTAFRWSSHSCNSATALKWRNLAGQYSVTSVSAPLHHWHSCANYWPGTRANLGSMQLSIRNAICRHSRFPRPPRSPICRVNTPYLWQPCRVNTPYLWQPTGRVDRPVDFLAHQGFI